MLHPPNGQPEVIIGFDELLLLGGQPAQAYQSRGELAGGAGLAVLLVTPGMAAQAVVALLAVAGFGVVAWRALSTEEQAGARVVLRNPRRIRAVLRGEPA